MVNYRKYVKTKEPISKRFSLVMFIYFKKYWFILGLAAIFVLILGDTTGTLTSLGKWVKNHHGTDLVMGIIFLCSGLMLDTKKIRPGLGDLKGVGAAMFLIFVVAPAFAYLMAKLPLSYGIVIGFFIVSAAPTTLSSGVVMTAAAGGNMPHALLVSLLSNSVAVLTVPLTLTLLMGGWGSGKPVRIEQSALIIKIGTLVLLPLATGLLLRFILKIPSNRPVSTLQQINQVLILVMVGVGVSQARDSLFAGGFQISIILLLVVLYHGIMLTVAVFIGRALRLPAEFSKSVLFMGSQKTLPLTLIVQVSAFPTYALALVVCVLHHLTQLFMDGYLVGWLQTNKHIDTEGSEKLS